MNGRFFRVHEVVRLTGLSERQLRQAIATGQLRVVRPPGMRVVLIPEEALADFLGVLGTLEPRAVEGSGPQRGGDRKAMRRGRGATSDSRT